MNYLEIIGTTIGLIYLWLEYKASIWLWAAGVVMPAVYIFVYYEAGLYADSAINIYYLLAAVVGWIVWMRGRRNEGDREELPISTLPQKFLLPLTAATAAIFIAIVWILVRFTDSDVPYLDSFTTALSVTGLWMLTRKYAEQWFAWIAVDVVSCGLYIYKGLYFTAFLYGFYSAIAVFGYFKWKALAISPCR